MNVFILGNGFDLQHGFLTKYINFLNIIEFLTENYDEKKMNTIGDVLSSPLLQQKDTDVKNSYELHKDIYYLSYLDPLKTAFLIKKAKENLWFQYFLSSVNKDVGWIDFEKEIGEVVEVFRELMKKLTYTFFIDAVFDKYPIKKDIISRFNFFYRKSGSNGLFEGRLVQGFSVIEKYVIEKPLGSNHYIIQKDEIVKDLYLSLRECADILKEYLFLFADNVAFMMNKRQKQPQNNIYSEAETVISFNYTKTLEYLYGKEQVAHLHGNVSENIVLGINPDNYDNLETLDTTFLQFKKYFQRVFYHTDALYLKKEQTTERQKNKYGGFALNISGHSLDITDKDVLKYWIELADKIFIYYYDQSEVAKYIKNLVAMFGKASFDKIRANNKLEFTKNPEIIWADK